MKTHTAKRMHAKSLLAHYTKHEEKATSSQKWFTTGRARESSWMLFVYAYTRSPKRVDFCHLNAREQNSSTLHCVLTED